MMSLSRFAVVAAVMLTMAAPGTRLWAAPVDLVLSRVSMTITHSGATPGSCATSLASQGVTEPCDSFSLKFDFKAAPKSTPAEKADIVDDLTNQAPLFFFSPDANFCTSGSLTDVVEARMQHGSLVHLGGSHWGFTGVQLGADFATLKQFGIFVNFSLTISNAGTGTISVQGNDSFESFSASPISVAIVIADKDGDPTLGNTELYCAVVTPTYRTQNF